jgi:transposase
MRGSGGFYVRAYPFEKQEAFFDGHIKCFEFMNGTPYKIAYDNLKTAVKKILEGSNREEQEQSLPYVPITFMNPLFVGQQKGMIKVA